MNSITQEDFERQYAERSDMTVEELRTWMHPVSCDCEDDICEGWAMISNEHDDEDGWRQL